MKAHFALLLALALPMSAGATAQASFPAIKEYGGIRPVEGASERPDPNLKYKAVFNITKGAPEPGKINASLEKVARFLNLLGADGVKPGKGDIVAIVHGAATPLVLSQEAFSAKFKTANPNLALIQKLQEAGVEVRVCSQALAGHKIDPAKVDRSVTIDVGALVTLTNLQLRGYALLPD